MNDINDFEMVSELVNKTGATFEEARYAYEACSKDMLAAAIMLEKSKANKTSATGSTSTASASGSFDSYDNSAANGCNNSNCFSSNRADYHEAWNRAKANFRSRSRTAAGCAGGFFQKLIRNSVKVNGSREFFSIPLIAALAITLVLWECIIPIMLISIFFGVRYTFTGPDFINDFVFGFAKPENQNYTQSNTADYTTAYTQQEESTSDNGFFTK